MTEAERFLREKLTPPKSIAVNRGDRVKSPRTESKVIELHVPKFLTNPLFSDHRTFWSIVAVLALIFVEIALVPPENVFERGCYMSLLAPFTFWIPVLLVAKWAWNQRFVRSLTWFAVVWMVVSHLLKITIQIDRPRDAEEFFSALTVFGIGGCGIAAVLWDAIKQKVKIVG